MQYDNSPIVILQGYLAAVKLALELAEVEMRYAGWQENDPENVGRQEAYKAVTEAQYIALFGNQRCEPSSAPATNAPAKGNGEQKGE